MNKEEKLSNHSKEEFIGDEQSLKEAAVIMINMRKRQLEIIVTPFLSKNDQKLKYWEARADEWMKKNLKNG